MVHFLLEIGLQFAPPATLTKSQPGGPAANGRPAPTSTSAPSSASAQADVRREAPKETDFNR